MHSTLSRCSSGVGDGLGDGFKYRLPPGLSLLGSLRDDRLSAAAQASADGVAGMHGSMRPTRLKSQRAVDRLVHVALAAPGTSAAEALPAAAAAVLAPESQHAQHAQHDRTRESGGGVYIPPAALVSPDGLLPMPPLGDRSDSLPLKQSSALLHPQTRHH